MTEKSSASADNVSKVYEKTSCMPKSNQVDLLAQALLREFMHRHGYLDTLKTFDTECERGADTISSRAVVRQLLNIPVQGGTSRLVPTAIKAAEEKKGKGKGKAVSQYSLMEELCSYRLTKRDYQIQRNAAAVDRAEGGSEGAPPKGDKRPSEKDNDPSDAEMEDLQSKCAEHDAALASAQAQLERGERLMKLYEAKGKEKKLRKLSHKKEKMTQREREERGDGEDGQGGTNSDRSSSDEKEGGVGDFRDKAEEGVGKRKQQHSLKGKKVGDVREFTKHQATSHSRESSPSGYGEEDSISSFSGAARPMVGSGWCPPGVLEDVIPKKKNNSNRLIPEDKNDSLWGVGGRKEKKKRSDEYDSDQEEEKSDSFSFSSRHSSSPNHQDSSFFNGTLRPSEQQSKMTRRKRHKDIPPFPSSVTNRRHRSSSTSSSNDSTSSWPSPAFGKSLRQQLLSALETAPDGSTSEGDESKGKVLGENRGSKGTAKGASNPSSLAHFSHELLSSFPGDDEPPSSSSSSLDGSAMTLQGTKSSQTASSTTTSSSTIVNNSTHSSLELQSPIHSPLQRLPYADGQAAHQLPKFGSIQKGTRRVPTPPRPFRGAGTGAAHNAPNNSTSTTIGGGGNRFYKGAGYNSNLSISLTSSHGGNFTSGGGDSENNNDGDDEDVKDIIPPEGIYRYDRTAKPLQSALVSSSSSNKGKWGGDGGGMSSHGDLSRGSLAGGPGRRGTDSGIQIVPQSSSSPGTSLSSTSGIYNNQSNTNISTPFQSFGGFSAPNFVQAANFSASPLSASVEGESHLNLGASGSCAYSASTNLTGGRASPDKSKRKDRKVTILVD